MENHFLLIRLGAETALIDAEIVQSVVELETVTPVPCTPRHVAGLAAMRSRPVTVIDCYQALGLAPAASDDTKATELLAVVVELDGHLYALRVDEVVDVLSLDNKVSTTRMKLRDGWARVQRGLLETGNGPALLIDPAALIAGMPAAAA
jgi:purine-binding chemotaxis protein CheW